MPEARSAGALRERRGARRRLEAVRVCGLGGARSGDPPCARERRPSPSERRPAEPAANRSRAADGGVEPEREEERERESFADRPARGRLGEPADAPGARDGDDGVAGSDRWPRLSARLVAGPSARVGGIFAVGAAAALAVVSLRSGSSPSPPASAAIAPAPPLPLPVPPPATASAVPVASSPPPVEAPSAAASATTPPPGHAKHHAPPSPSSTAAPARSPSPAASAPPKESPADLLLDRK